MRTKMGRGGSRCRGLKGSYVCDSPAYDGTGYCDDCTKLRRQHTTSHDMEGHSWFVPMCILCERLLAIGA